MRVKGEDFVEVRLSARGEQLAAGAAIEFGGGNYHFRFEPGKSQRVTRAGDWERVLSREQMEGEPLLEIVAAAPEAAKKSSAKEEGNVI